MLTQLIVAASPKQSPFTDELTKVFQRLRNHSTPNSEQEDCFVGSLFQMTLQLHQEFLASPRNDELWCELAREPVHTFKTYAKKSVS